MMRRALPFLLLFIPFSAGPGAAVFAAGRPYFSESYEQAQRTAFRYDWKYHEGIMITGVPDFIERVSEALAVIEERDPRSWYFVRKHVRKITLTGHPGMDVVSGRLMSGGLDGESTIATAGGIVHEAWHRELRFRGKNWEGREAERACIEQQNDFLSLAGAPPLDVDDTLATEYWKVDYWSRDW